MVFNSVGFLFFFPAVVASYFALPHRFRWILLLLASYFFYCAWNFRLIWLILFTTVVSYCAALLLTRTKNKKLRKAELLLTLISCLSVLVFFKYFDFLSLSVTGILRAIQIPAREYTLNLILPVGISFYTFQTLSYVIDVYYERLEAEKHFGYYALYVSYFPQLVAGPIERVEALLPQLKKEHAFSTDDFTAGIRIVVSGFVKKVVVADTVAGYVNAVFNNTAQATGLSVLIAALLFAVQIYCDFSGYTDIAIGCARIMGIRLMKNFDYPYRAKSIKEFWSRWHISLSSWLRDYIYIPLGGNRCTRSRRLFNMLVVFLVSGFWHGAAWTFVLWGILHAVYQIVGELTLDGRNRLLKMLGLTSDSRPVRLIRQVVTFTLVDYAWMLFRANSISDFFFLSRKLFIDWEISMSYLTDSMHSLDGTAYQLLACALCVVIMILCDLLFTNGKGYGRSAIEESGFLHTQKNIIYLLWTIAIAWLLLLAGDGASSFIYFQF